MAIDTVISAAVAKAVNALYNLEADAASIVPKATPKPSKL